MSSPTDIALLSPRLPRHEGANGPASDAQKASLHLSEVDEIARGLEREAGAEERLESCTKSHQRQATIRRAAKTHLHADG